jgi:hypothetical protein
MSRKYESFNVSQYSTPQLPVTRISSLLYEIIEDYTISFLFYTNTVLSSVFLHGNQRNARGLTTLPPSMSPLPRPAMAYLRPAA